MGHDLGTLDGTAQAQLVASGELSATELVEAAIDRIERVDATVGAVVIPLFEAALEEAASDSLPAGPFRGVPTLVKDSLPAAGAPWYRATRVMREAESVADHDAYVVGQMRKAGFILLGKSNLPELEGGITTEPVANGPTRNPWNPDYSVGGSSGGSAAAVAAGMVPLALGVDGGGSIRIPSSICGLVGLKPTKGRTSVSPEFTEQGFSTANMITRSVRDCARALDAISGQPAGDHYVALPPTESFAAQLEKQVRPLRIGTWSPAQSSVNAAPECVTAVEDAGRLLESLGHHVETAHPETIDEGLPPAFFIAAAAYIAWQVGELERCLGRPIEQNELEPVTWAAVEGGRMIPGTMLQQSFHELRLFANHFGSWWDEGWDLLLTPTLAVAPYKLGSLTPPSEGEPWPDIVPWVPFTPQFNLAGQPAISVPLHWTADGLPVGVQLGGRFAEDALLLQVAAQLEAARPWADRRPPVHA
jgi:amidase